MLFSSIQSRANIASMDRLMIPNIYSWNMVYAEILKFNTNTEKIISYSSCSTFGQLNFIQIVSDRKITNFKFSCYVTKFAFLMDI